MYIYICGAYMCGYWSLYIHIHICTHGNNEGAKPCKFLFLCKVGEKRCSGGSSLDNPTVWRQRGIKNMRACKFSCDLVVCATDFKIMKNKQT